MSAEKHSGIYPDPSKFALDVVRSAKQWTGKIPEIKSHWALDVIYALATCPAIPEARCREIVASICEVLTDSDYQWLRGVL